MGRTAAHETTGKCSAQVPRARFEVDERPGIVKPVRPGHYPCGAEAPTNFARGLGRHGPGPRGAPSLNHR